jgi:hypothetical protein
VTTIDPFLDGASAFRALTSHYTTAKDDTHALIPLDPPMRAGRAQLPTSQDVARLDEGEDHQRNEPYDTMRAHASGGCVGNRARHHSTSSMQKPKGSSGRRCGEEHIACIMVPDYRSSWGGGGVKNSVQTGCKLRPVQPRSGLKTRGRRCNPTLAKIRCCGSA